jgi:hypothetical protein
MACDISLGRLEPCKDSVGGLVAVYFINYGDTDMAITYDGTDTDVIDDIGTAVAAYKYDLQGSSTLEQAVTSSRENGTTFIEQTLTLSLKKLTKKDHKELKLMIYGRPYAVVQDRNDNLFFAGLQYGMEVTGGTIATGTAMGDFSGYTLTLTGMEKIPANFCIPATGTTIAEQLTALGLTVTAGV